MRPSLQDLERAHEIFLEIEPRQLFYRVASQLVRLAREGSGEIDLAEALAVLLLTWNRRYYNRKRPFTEQHVQDIQTLCEEWRGALDDVESRSIANLDDQDKENVQSLFRAFGDVLGPVGASKALHLLAPDFFALWDNPIAEAYGKALNTPYKERKTAEGYWAFMQETHSQYSAISCAGDIPLLKYLDEYNYLKYKKKDRRL